MISIPVTGTVFIVLMVLGGLAYLWDGAQKVKARQQRKAVQQELHADLAAPAPATELPYGFSGGEPDRPTSQP